MQRKLIALLLAAVLLLSLSAAADTLDALDGSEALTLQVDSAAFTQLNASEAGTDVLNAFLKPLSAEISLTADQARLAFSANGEEISALRVAGDSPAGAKALPMQALRDVFETALPQLYAACVSEEEPPEPTVKNTSVRNLPRSTQRTDITVTPEQLAAAQDSLAVFRAAAAALCAHLDCAEEITAWADALTAAGDLNLRRLEDAEGRAIAWQLTGRVSRAGEDVRKLTLYGGVSGMNTTVTLKLPARSGKNDLQLTIDLKEKKGKKENSWDGTISFKRTMNGDTVSIKDTIKLRNALGDSEALTGSVKREVVKDGIKAVWTLVPALTGDGRTLSGTATLTKKHAQTQVWQLQLRLSLSAAAPQQSEAADDPAVFRQELLRWLSGYFSALSPAEQRQLAHMLRTDSWMNGPAVPAIP